MEASQKKRRSRVERLLSVLEGQERVVVLAHDNPDPDAVAAVFAEPLWDRLTTGLSALGSHGYQLGAGTGYGASGPDELTASRINSVE